MKRKRVRRQATSADELRALFRVVERDLEQAEVPGLYSDGRYAFIYNAALQLATIVLRLKGVRVVAPGHHRETFHVVEPLVPEAMQSIVAEFEHARRKRNTVMYDQAGTISEHEVNDLREAVKEFATWVRVKASASLADQDDE
ncbi:hypothetical protein KAX14_04605 [Candidatus Bipolaricaulota bacterium]|nr:hypothetical protein [Candidatus Bipolaricaulota bacterium]